MFIIKIIGRHLGLLFNNSNHNKTPCSEISTRCRAQFRLVTLQLQSARTQRTTLSICNRHGNIFAMLFNVTPLLDGRNQVGIVVAIILGYYIKKRFFKSKRRFQKLKPPFAKDSRTPLTPLETEQAKRDEILKKGINCDPACYQTSLINFIPFIYPNSFHKGTSN